RSDPLRGAFYVATLLAGDQADEVIGGLLGSPAEDAGVAGAVLELFKIHLVYISHVSPTERKTTVDWALTPTMRTVSIPIFQISTFTAPDFIASSQAQFQRGVSQYSAVL